MIIAAIPALVAIIGLLVFGLANGKISQVGLALFLAGMVALMIAMSHQVARLP